MRKTLCLTLNQIALMQLDVIKALEKTESENVRATSINYTPRLEVGENGFKITVGELPSRVKVYDRYVFEAGKITSRHYQAVRDYWYGLMDKALQGYEKEPIDPALIYILYHMPKNADVDNLQTKFIIDGLMYFKGIAFDDNVEHVKAVSEGTAICKKGEEKTEIHVVKYDGGIEDFVKAKLQL